MQIRARHAVSIQTLPVHISVKKLAEPPSKAHFEAFEQTCRLRPLEASGAKYLFVTNFLLPKFTVTRIESLDV
jgi:hypothetical protein